MTDVAFKEWASVCMALQTGRQTIILRKGGLHEGREGFRVRHRQFWLFPTTFHQSDDDLAPDALPLLAAAQRDRPPRGQIPISLLADVQETVELRELSQLLALTTCHVWSTDTVHQRFHYRQPGLTLLATRVYRTPHPHLVVETSHMAGCRSWVELPTELSREGLQPVLTDDEFQARWAEIRRLIRPRSASGLESPRPD